jgi:hypothetical protein
VSTSVHGRARKLEEQGPPDWSPVPDPATAGRRPVVATAWRAAAGVVVAALLWWLGRESFALVLLTVLVLTTAASLLFPAVASVLDRVTRAIERGAGRVLSLVLLGAVQLLVFTPLSLLLRLVRHDPLALGLPANARSLWRPAPAARGRRPLYRRQFTYERPATEGPERGTDRLPLPRLRVVLGVVAMLALADVAIGAALHAWDHTGDARPAGPRHSLLLDPHAAAGRGKPWLGTLAGEIDQVWYGKRYDPYLGWTMPDFAGRYLHTAGGVRRSYEPSGGRGPGAVSVFFFGGSTMFGLFQRDEHTIPSDVARLAQADGIPIRVYNYGQMAYNNWQEQQLLEQLSSRGITPELAVFYDGVNELVNQFRLGPHTEPSQQEAREYAKRIGIGAATPATPGNGDDSPLTQLYHSWQDVSATTWLSRRLRGVPTETLPKTAPLVSPWAGDQQREALASGSDAASLLGRGVDVTRHFADSSGFRTVFFLQPFLYSKPAVPGEEHATGSLGTDPAAWKRAYAIARSKLKPPVVDMAGALDSVKAPIMYDFAHTNELGAAVVARALYDRLKPTLRQLYRRGSR